MPQCRHSPPLNTNEAENTLPIHRPNESSSQGNQDSTPPSSPIMAVSRSSPSFSHEINQTTLDNNAESSIQLPQEDGSFSQVQELLSDVSTSEGDEPISKVFHPVING